MSSNNHANGGNIAPPPPNPILNAYEQFLHDTPYVTRSVLTTLCVTWILNCFVDISHATATIPLFCLLKYELYRLIVSPLICQSFLSLLFAFLSFTDNGKRLEFSIGSAAFGWYLFAIGISTNITFLLILLLANAVTNDPVYLMYRSLGIWTILFGVVATECSRAPQGSRRRLFFVTVPTLYYPLAMWGLFTLLGGFELADLLSIGVGYLYGWGFLNFLILSPARLQTWEETFLVNFTQQPGWIVGHAASGEQAWLNNASASGFSLVTTEPSRENEQELQRVHSNRLSQPTEPTFPSTGGRTLGSGPIRRSADRAALLAAAEKRAIKQNEGEDQV